MAVAACDLAAQVLGQYHIGFVFGCGEIGPGAGRCQVQGINAVGFGHIFRGKEIAGIVLALNDASAANMSLWTSWDKLFGAVLRHRDGSNMAFSSLNSRKKRSLP